MSWGPMARRSTRRIQRERLVPPRRLRHQRKTIKYVKTNLETDPPIQHTLLTNQVPPPTFARLSAAGTGRPTRATQHEALPPLAARSLSLSDVPGTCVETRATPRACVKQRTSLVNMSLRRYHEPKPHPSSECAPPK
jgi:hypothetical protein